MSVFEQIIVGFISFISFECLCSGIGGFKGFLVCLFGGTFFGVAIPLFLDMIIREMYEKKGKLSDNDLRGNSIEDVKRMRKKYRDAIDQGKEHIAFEEAVAHYDMSRIDGLMTEIKEDLNRNFKFRLQTQIEPADAEKEFTYETASFKEYVKVSAEEYKVGHEYWDDGDCFHCVYIRTFHELEYKNRASRVEQVVIENAIAAFMRYRFMKVNPLAKVSGQGGTVWVDVKKKVRNPKYRPDLK